MCKKSIRDKKNQGSNHLAMICLLSILLIFLITASFVAIKMGFGVIPDEGAHFMLIAEFDKTLGIPNETEATIKRGVFIEGNPFLYYWLIARIRNILFLLIPSLTDSIGFYAVKLISVFLSVGTLISTWFLAKEIIDNEWLQLLPVFLLANLQMFFILSTGINYDNLVTLLCTLAILFIIRIAKQKPFWENTFLLAIFLGLAALSKKTALPLVLILVIIWCGLLIKLKPGPIHLIGRRIVLFILAVLVVSLNLFMYGRNLIVYKKIIPGCYQLATESQCSESNFIAREREQGLEEKLSFSQATEQGYPSFIEYYFEHWSKAMIERNVGIFGHKVYSNPMTPTVTFFLIVLIILCFTQIRKPALLFWILLGIACAYTIILYFLIMTCNYRLDLKVLAFREDIFFLLFLHS